MAARTAPTLEDVSRATGVSTATISRVLNAPGKVAPATRNKVTAAIEELGYTPNHGGRALASNRSNTVGAIIPTLANAVFAMGIQSFQEALSDAGITLLLASTGYDPEQEQQQIRALVSQGADGLLLIGHERPAATRRFLELRGVPHVLAWCFEDDPDALFAGFDNRKAAYSLAKKVLDMGHRNIAQITGDIAGNDRAQRRREGVEAAIADHPSKARLTGTIQAPFLLEPSGDAFATLVAGPDRPTAIICGSDVHAAGATVRAAEMGIKVPEDISIVGFDDIGLASVVTPPLTTLRIPQVEMGRMAADLLLRKIAGQGDVQSVELPTEIVMRGSLAPPSG